jgi:hypothetical protein
LVLSEMASGSVVLSVADLPGKEWNADAAELVSTRQRIYSLNIRRVQDPTSNTVDGLGL